MITSLIQLPGNIPVLTGKYVSEIYNRINPAIMSALLSANDR